MNMQHFESRGRGPKRTGDGSFPAAQGASRMPMLWGMDAVELHDRVWRARGVWVVRPGDAISTPDDPHVTFLLLDDSTLVDAHPRQLRLACEHHVHRVPLDYAPISSACEERVRADRDGRLLRFEREYHNPPENALAFCGLTRCPRAASRWARLAPAAAAQFLKREAVRGHGRNRRVRSYHSRDREHALAWMGRVAATGLSPAECGLGSTLESLGDSGWVAGGSIVEPGAMLIGPVWIGRGVVVKEGTVLLGPCVVPDVSGDVHEGEAAVMSVAGQFAAMRRRPGKRVFDAAVALVALVVMSPIMLLAALFVLLEDGRPVFFVQQRQTRGGRNFGCLKFRTMQRDADDIKSALSSVNACDGPQFFARHDPRVLQIGRLLRRWHIDELPQLINVLRGDMSLVGPRPSPESENQLCPAWREARLSVPAGLTGQWQVRRTRSPQLDFQEWIRHDMTYVQKQSWRLDLRILCETVLAIVWRERAVPSRDRVPEKHSNRPVPQPEARRVAA